MRKGNEGDVGWSRASVEEHRLYLLQVGATLRDIRYGVAYEFRGRPMLIEYVFDSVTQRKRPRYYHMGST